MKAAAAKSWSLAGCTAAAHAAIGQSARCAALPEDLVESELLGNARAAFTGAVAERPGVFEEARTGTLLLDEIGELSLRAQAKVLRVIQDGELRRIGERVSRHVDVRIVSATNRDLRQGRPPRDAQRGCCGGARALRVAGQRPRSCRTCWRRSR